MANPPFMLINAPTRLLLQLPIEEPVRLKHQVVHTDVVYVVNGFKGGLSTFYTHFLTFCPYGDGSQDYEDPVINVSNNPTVQWWKDNIPNPIDTINAVYTNSDVDLLFINDVWYLYYRDTTGGGTIRRRNSYNLIDWSNEDTITGILSDILSPSVIYDPDIGKWYMWGVRTSDYTVVRYESNDGLTWSNLTLTDIPPTWVYGGTTRYCWHCDVQKTRIGKKYYMFLTSSSGAGGAHPTMLWWLESDNGISWTRYDIPILSPSVAGWDNVHIYRSSFYIVNKKIKAYYSGCKLTTPPTWGAGFTEADLDFIDEGDTTLNVIGTPPTIDKACNLMGKGWGFRRWNVPKTMWE